MVRRRPACAWHFFYCSTNSFFLYFFSSLRLFIFCLLPFTLAICCLLIINSMGNAQYSMNVNLYYYFFHIKSPNLLEFLIFFNHFVSSSFWRCKKNEKNKIKRNE